MCSPMPALFLPTFTKVTFLAISLGSMLFLVSGIKDRNAEVRRSTLSIITGIAGLIYVALGFYWYDHVGPWHSRTMAIAFYVARHFTAGIAIGMLLYVTRLANTRFLLAVSSLSLIVINALAMMRRPAIRVLSLEEGLFGGLFIVSLVLFWLERRPEMQQTAGMESRPG